MCVPTLPKIFKPVTQNTLIFFFGLKSLHQIVLVLSSWSLHFFDKFVEILSPSPILQMHLKFPSTVYRNHPIDCNVFFFVLGGLGSAVLLSVKI